MVGNKPIFCFLYLVLWTASSGDSLTLILQQRISLIKNKFMLPWDSLMDCSLFFFSTMKLNSSATMSYLSPLQLRSVVMKMWLQRYVPNSSKSSVSQQWFSQSWDLKHGIFNKVEWLRWFYKCVLQWDSKEPTLYNAEQQPRSMGVFNLC